MYFFMKFEKEKTTSSRRTGVKSTHEYQINLLGSWESWLVTFAHTYIPKRQINNSLFLFRGQAQQI